MLNLISLSKPVFFKSGRMWAVLSVLGIIDSRSDMLTISVIRGIYSALHSFRSQVGKGSSSHDLTGDSLIIFHISASVASIKVFSGTPEKQFVTETPVCVSVNPSSLLMLNILWWKRRWNRLPVFFYKYELGGSCLHYSPSYS